MDTSTGRQWSVFYAYTAWSVVGVLVLLPLAFALYLGSRVPESFAAEPVTSCLLVLLIAAGAWSGWRSLQAWSRSAAPVTRDRWDLPRVGTLPSDRSLVAVWALVVVIAVLVLAGGGDERLLVLALTAGLTTTVMRGRWELGAAAAVLFGAGMVALTRAPGAALGSVLLLVAAVLTVRLSLWLAAMVRELDEAREAQAALAVAEERLRFARDLHDVTGRDLSVIAVKSELVAQLAEREDPRAVEHGREVAQIARTSLAEIRALVRGYRKVDLASELRGTASLLRSAHARVTVEGSAEDIPASFAETAAWVLREGGTNVLRHADPLTVTIRLHPDGVTVTNDGAPGSGDVHEGSGLTGMRERLGPHATLSTRRENGTFTLDVRFDAPGGPR